MAKIMTDSKHYTDIANAIREKTGSTEQMKPSEMPGQIGSIKSYSEGYDAGIVDGKQAEHAAIINPNWTDWSHFAGPSSLRPIDVNCLHYSDTANGTNFNDFVANSWQLTEVPPIDTSNGNTFLRMFYFCRSLRTIGELNLSKATSVTSMFDYCEALIHIHFVPGSIHLSLDLSKCKALDNASIQDTVDGYADMTGQTSPTLTVHATVGAKMTDAQKATLTAKNVTLVITE